MDEAAHVQVTTTAPDEAQAARLAEAVLQARLAACVQVVGPVQSRYWWKGDLETAREWLCLMKTTRDRLDALVRLVGERHPYAVPEITATPIVHGNAAYLAWIGDETRAGDGP